MFAVHNNLQDMEFVDRTDETARLNKALAGDKSSLVVIYGRRRLGKSTLIKRVLTERDIYFLADKSESLHQISLLAKVIAQTITDFDKVTYPDWETLLRALNYRATQKFTLCLDEFPYLVAQSSDLPSVLQKLIDEKQLQYNIVVCGSSQNMMYGIFLDSTSPLYGRADVILRLSPIRIPYLQEALQLEATTAIEEYAVWGGVPRYWELRENCASLREALWQNVLSANGTLYEEPIKLFQDDVNDVVKTSTIISYIGAGAHRLSEIAARSQEPATNLSRPLKKLVDLGFVEREIPFGAEEKNAKKSLYKISDPFMSFYYKFIAPNKSFIELGRSAPIEKALEEHFDEFVAMHWEKICRDAVTGNEINGTLYGKASRWWGSFVDSRKHVEQAEFDVVAESLDKKYLLVGECKWTNPENSEHLTSELLRKARLLPAAKGKTIVPMLFLKNTPTGSIDNVMLPADVIKLSY
jgi:hypothetical protein